MKAEKAISRRTKEARIKNRQLKCRQEDDLADDPSNPSYGSAEAHRMLSNTYGEPLSLKERAESGFNASRTVTLTSKTSTAFGGTSSA
ncbi:hypothetical protein TNCV_3023511 [Trichonephila clavipes]|uniref:Uncharacterized protein n=1 Tax=Trichonephila clavipes TaxID=2585209 RepID=A0A8X6RZQ3_TRICX|nr:hypothetical protein TNCV_3023511 [Trichonephila clavipes]